MPPSIGTGFDGSPGLKPGGGLSALLVKKIKREKKINKESFIVKILLVQRKLELLNSKTIDGRMICFLSMFAELSGFLS